MAGFELVPEVLFFEVGDEVLPQDLHKLVVLALISRTQFSKKWLSGRSQTIHSTNSCPPRFHSEERPLSKIRSRPLSVNIFRMVFSLKSTSRKIFSIFSSSRFSTNLLPRSKSFCSKPRQIWSLTSRTSGSLRQQEFWGILR